MFSTFDTTTKGSISPYVESLNVVGPTIEQLKKYPALLEAWNEFQIIYKLTVPDSERIVKNSSLNYSDIGDIDQIIGYLGI